MITRSSTKRVLELLQERHPGQTRFYRKDINVIAEELKLEGADYPHELCTAEYKVHKGFYDFGRLIGTTEQQTTTAPVEAPKEALKMSGTITSVLNTDGYVPAIDDTYVRWGYYDDVAQIIKRRSFFPVFIAGLSGNGKSVMVEQAAATSKREYIRVQISPETDEDDLLGGFRLINGETVFHKGPVVKAMERGCILLLDEMDRGTNKIMCLQGVLEGKPIMIKKTGEMIFPAPGFNIFATANTKGRGSDDGKFAAATIIDEAFLERFACTFEQPYPSSSVEKKIVIKHMEKYFGTDRQVDEDFAQLLVTWSETVRKTFDSGGINDVISTRRLCHIVQTFAIFGERLKAVELCLARFDADTKSALKDLYTKIDSQVSAKPAPKTASAAKPNNIPF